MRGREKSKKAHLRKLKEDDKKETNPRLFSSSARKEKNAGW